MLFLCSGHGQFYRYKYNNVCHDPYKHNVSMGAACRRAGYASTYGNGAKVVRVEIVGKRQSKGGNSGKGVRVVIVATVV
jgi:hypothetical protein